MDNIWHGLHNLAICSEKALEDYDAAEGCLEEFNQLVTYEHLSARQVYNTDETLLFWRNLPWMTAAIPQESAQSGFKDSGQINCASMF
jgi:hypothetical protein